MISRNDPCWCGSGKKWKNCHYPHEGTFNRFKTSIEYINKYGIILKNAKQVEGIKRASKQAAIILNKLCQHAKAGITTQELDDLSMSLHKEAGAIPAPLGYGSPPFPKSICTSINEVICHGIPDNTVLQEGDIINIDVTSIVDGYYGDCSRMVVIGKTTEERQRVVDVAYECMMRSIAICKPGIYLSQIGEVIEDYATLHNCSVVDVFVGHGIGIGFHEPPQVPHHRNDYKLLLVPGMTFTIEPMINAGVKDAVIDAKDQWTARTKDLKPSAQWEHTIVITDTSHEILTQL